MAASFLREARISGPFAVRCVFFKVWIRFRFVVQTTWILYISANLNGELDFRQNLPIVFGCFAQYFALEAFLKVSVSL
jgi:hypothetical protein